MPRKLYVQTLILNVVVCFRYQTGPSTYTCFCLKLASRKGGLGAQKVSNQSFSELEKKAQAADKVREKEEGSAVAKKNITSEESR